MHQIRERIFMTKALWITVVMLMGLASAASPALAQGPKHNADKVRDQIERRDRDRVRHDDRDDDRDRDRERRRDIFTRDEHGRPPVTTATASSAQRSISTKVTKRLRSLP